VLEKLVVWRMILAARGPVRQARHDRLQAYGSPEGEMRLSDWDIAVTDVSLIRTMR